MAEPSAQDDFAKLSADLATLRSDVAQLAETLATRAKIEGEAAAEAVSRKVRYGKAKAEATAAGLMDEGVAAYEDAKARAQSLGSEVGATIERNPFGSVMAALGIGFLFGVLSRGRN